MAIPPQVPLTGKLIGLANLHEVHVHISRRDQFVTKTFTIHNGYFNICAHGLF